MSGIKKCGVYPLNPGEISDRQLALTSDPQLCTSQFTPEQIILFHEEGFDLENSEYTQLLEMYHPEDGGLVVSESSHGVSNTCSVVD